MCWRQVFEKKVTKRERLLEESKNYIEHNVFREGQSVSSLLTMFAKLSDEDQQSILASLCQAYDVRFDWRGHARVCGRDAALREIEHRNDSELFAFHGAAISALIVYLSGETLPVSGAVLAIGSTYAGGFLGWGLNSWSYASTESNWDGIEERGAGLINSMRFLMR